MSILKRNVVFLWTNLFMFISKIFLSVYLSIKRTSFQTLQVHQYYIRTMVYWSIINRPYDYHISSMILFAACLFEWMFVIFMHLTCLEKEKNVFLGNPLKSFEVYILLPLKYFIITLNDISISWVTHMATSLNLYTNMSRKDWLKNELRRKIEG